jgi:hypothetical protein
VFWERNASGIFSPVYELLVEGEMVSARYLDSLAYLTLTTNKSAVIYDVKERREVLRVTHDMDLKDAFLSNNRENGTKLTLYAWKVDGTVTAWKIVGNSTTFFSFATEPLFTCHATLFTCSLMTENGLNMSIFNYTKADDIDAVNGHVLREFHTRSREAIVDGCQAVTSSGTPGVLFATRTSIFMDVFLTVDL